MPEQEAGNPATTEPTPIAPKKSKSLMLPIIGGAVVFIAFIVIFSLKFGVFSSSNVKQTPPTENAQAAKPDSVSKPAEETKAADPYEGLFSDFDNQQSGDDQEDTAAVKDSVAKVAWYDQQKKDIETQMTQLQVEQTKLQSLKAEVDGLLQRKKAMEDGNIVQMAKLYEGMATEEVVPILSNLTDAQVSVLISKMKKQKASEVLGKLPPERAAKITQYLLSMTDN